jgi:metal-dependent amidase/aminoacylase/carboxypeptidase family protein
MTRPSSAVEAIRSRHAAGETDRWESADVAVLLAEIDRLRTQLSGGTVEYAVRAVIDGQPGEMVEYGTERDALEIRLEQHREEQLADYRLVVLARHIVRTEWLEQPDASAV